MCIISTSVHRVGVLILRTKEIMIRVKGRNQESRHISGEGEKWEVREATETLS